MSKLEKELDDLLSSTEGSGFGDPDALRNHERKIENLRFKIGRRDNYRIAVMSALIGAMVSVATIFVSGMFGNSVP